MGAKFNGFPLLSGEGITLPSFQRKLESSLFIY
jgi:hypothetical protein